MSNRELSATAFERVELALDTTFTISRGSTERTTNHLVTVTDRAGRVGLGGAAPAAYYDEDGDSVEAALPDLLGAVESVGDPTAQQDIERRLAEQAPDEAAARAAVSIAVQDLVAKQRNEPLYRAWGLSPDRAPVTSVTVGIDDPAARAGRARAWREAGYPALKIKLGTPDDMPRLEAVREGAPDADIIVDANEGWSADAYQELAPHLIRLGVTMVEQPLPAGDDDLLREIERPLQVCADESCHDTSSLPYLAGKYDMINIKLDKTGGLTEALKLKKEGLKQGYKIMVGCMVGSSLAMAPATLLAQGAEIVDLDGPLLLAEDRDNPLQFDNQNVYPPTRDLWG